ncbi:MAG: hypothetical protein O2963_04455, partial [Proteobacteria bacterium]|nr:hypothetical protein [Pseudomonadota bacterium]
LKRLVNDRNHPQGCDLLYAVLTSFSNDPWVASLPYIVESIFNRIIRTVNPVNDNIRKTTRSN